MRQKESNAEAFARAYEVRQENKVRSRVAFSRRRRSQKRRAEFANAEHQVRLYVNDRPTDRVETITGWQMWGDNKAWREQFVRELDISRKAVMSEWRLER